MAIAPNFPSAPTSLREVDGSLSYDLATDELHNVELDPIVHTLDDAVQGAPILALMNQIGRPRVVKQPIYLMLRQRQFPRFFNAASTFTAAAADFTIAAADVNKLKQGYHILNTLTREIMMVNAAPATTLPVDRAIGVVAALANLTSTDEFLILGYRSAELDSKFQDRIRQPEVIFNYVAELQDTYGVSAIESASGRAVGGDPIKALRMAKIQEMRIRVEDAIMWDQRAKYQRSYDSKWVYKTGGVDSFCTENETNFSGALDESSLLTACTTLSRHGPTDRLVLAAPKFMERFNLAFVGDRRLNSAVPNRVGIRITTYEC